MRTAPLAGAVAIRSVPQKKRMNIVVLASKALAFSFRFVPCIFSSRPPLSSTMMPSGILTAKSQGQVVTDRMAPAMPGPAAEEIAMTMALIPMIGPSMCCGKAERRFIMASAMIAPAPSPCAKRARISRERSPAKAQAAEAAVNSATPIRKTRRAP